MKCKNCGRQLGNELLAYLICRILKRKVPVLHMYGSNKVLFKINKHPVIFAMAVPTIFTKCKNIEIEEEVIQWQKKKA